MELPIKFPSNVDVIAEEVARFRALSPLEQIESLDEMFRVYHFLEAQSPNPDVLARLARDEEDRGRTAIQEFVTRHGR